MMLITPLLFSILSFVAAAQRTGETVCNSDQNLCVLAVPDTPTPVPNVPGSNLAARYQYGPGYGYPSTTQSSLPGYTTAPQPGYTQPSTEDSDARRPISNLLLAHIVCGCLATLLFIPLGILGPRVARTFTTSRLWFPAHASVQGLISTSLVVATYSCARVLTQQQDTSNLDSPHRRMGVAILTLVLFQACLGAIVHWVKLPRRDDSGRSFKHYFHIFLGLVIAILGFSQPATGMWQEMPRWYYPTPGWNWRAGWIVVVCVWVIAYVSISIVSLVRRAHRRGNPTASPDSHQAKLRPTTPPDPAE